MLQEGEPCPALMLVESGHLRVFKTSESGRQITLYRVHPGDACVIGMSCALSGAMYPANVDAPIGCEAVIVPARVFKELFAVEPAVQSLVIDRVSVILSELMTLVAEVAFRRVDQRLAKFLLDDASGEVRLSHEQIATNLGTAREVVSRLLENFRDDGWISVDRRRISVLDRAALSSVLER